MNDLVINTYDQGLIHARIIYYSEYSKPNAQPIRRRLNVVKRKSIEAAYKSLIHEKINGEAYFNHLELR